MASIFTRIVNGEIPCHKVAENERFLAFLDINPNASGHTLCIPKTEIDKVWDMEEEHYLALMAFSRQVARVLESQVECRRVGMSLIGLEVPHVHVHLIPLRDMEDARFTTKANMSAEELGELALKLSEAYAEAYG